MINLHQTSVDYIYISTHSVVTLVTLSLVARLWPVMMDTVELWGCIVLLSAESVLAASPCRSRWIPRRGRSCRPRPRSSWCSPR